VIAAAAIAVIAASNTTKIPREADFDRCCIRLCYHTNGRRWNG
jgi:hypothetical protein